MLSKVTSILSKATGDANPDPDRLLTGWVSSRSPPKWYDKDSYQSCRHCKDPFVPHHQHNCRLCGHLFCSRCTEKYNLPDKFKPKGKQGPVRVCVGCRQSVLGSRGDKVKSFKNPLVPYTMAEFKDGKRMIHPPKWQAKESAKGCTKCGLPLTKGRGHNCRTCGLVFCSGDTVKMDVPLAFRKKGKIGPVRVCDGCRYFIKGGAILDPSPCQRKSATVNASLSPSASAYAPSDPAEDSSDTESDDEAPPPPPPEDTPVFAPPSQPDVVVLAPPPSKPEEKKMDVAFRWEGLDLVIVALRAVSENTTLEKLHEQLLQQRAELKDKKFDVLYKETVVNKLFFDVFCAKHFARGKIYLRETKQSTKEEETKKRQQKVLEDAIANNGSSNGVLAEVKAGQIRVQALYDFKGKPEKQHLSFKKGEYIVIINRDNPKWWYGSNNAGVKGWVPKNYVCEVPATVAPERVTFAQQAPN